MGRTLVICATAFIIAVIGAAVTCYRIETEDRYIITDAKLEGFGHIILDRRTGEVRRIRTLTLTTGAEELVVPIEVVKSKTR